MDKRGERIKKCYYIAVVVSLLVFVLSILVTHGNSMKLYLWKAGSSFYDFFFCIKNDIYWNRSKVYDARNIYPPLANVIYMMITRCMSVETLQKIQSMGINEIRTLQEGGFYFLLYMNTLLLFFYAVCTSWKKGSGKEKNLFAFTMAFTIPFLYQYERANIIFLALCFTMVFFLWKDSENRVQRELSFLALACAAGIKIYPAIFGITLLRERRYKEAARLMIYGVLVFFLPFLCFGGVISNLKKMIANMQNITGEFRSVRIGCQLNYSASLKYLFGWLEQYSTVLIWMFVALAVCLGIFSLFVLRSRWKAILLMTCLLIGIPAFSYTYVGIFMVIPIIAFLDTTETRSKTDYLYLIGMLLMILPIPFCWQEGRGETAYSYLNVTTPVLVEELSLLIMTIMLIGTGLADFWREGNKKRHRQMTTAVLLVLIGAAAVSSHKLSESYDYTNYLKKTLGEAVEMTDGDLLEQEFTAKGTKLDRIVLKLTPSEETVLECSVTEVSTGKMIKTVRLEKPELKNGYNEINFGPCELKKNETYLLQLRVTNPKDSLVKVFHTAENLSLDGETASVNGDPAAWYLGVQIYQYQ